MSARRGSSHVVRPGEKRRVVIFCHGAPNSHMGKCTWSADVNRSSSFISSISQRGPCRASRKARGKDRSPRSIGFSITNCTPACQPSRRRVHMRATMALASLSSRRWAASTSGRPCMCSRSRTGGGASSFSKKRLTLDSRGSGVCQILVHLLRCKRSTCGSRRRILGGDRTSMYHVIL